MAFGKEFSDISQRDPAWLKGKGLFFIIQNLYLHCTN